MPSQQLCPQCRRSRWIPRYTAPYCTPSCKRAGQPPIVACCICGHLHQAASTGVLYRSADRQWWCRNELACRRRQRQHQAEVAAMWRALDEVWGVLEANGWRI